MKFCIQFQHGNRICVQVQEKIFHTLFLQHKITNDTTLAEAIAVVVDPKFKPTTFKERPIDNSPLPPTPPPPPPPPPSNSP